METSDLSQLSEELMGRLGSGDGLDSIMGSDFFDHQENIHMDQSSMDTEDNESDDVIVLHMDIQEPLSSLKKLVETKYGFKLTGYQFWLQDTQELEPNKNLVDQCVKGEGLVQINVQIRIIERRINIVDVLKPTEEALAAVGQTKRFEELSNEDSSPAEDESSRHTEIDDDDTNLTNNNINNNENKKCVESNQEDGTKKDDVSSSEEKRIGGEENTNTEDSIDDDRPCQDWVLDQKFKKQQTSLQIPEDPVDWTVEHVQHWFQWAVTQFDLMEFKDSDWLMSGKELCAMTHQEFRDKMPKDPSNVFWTHLQLLKECKFVSVMANISKKSKEEHVEGQPQATDNNEPKIMRKIPNNSKSSVSNSSEASVSRGVSLIQSASTSFGTGSGNNGQMQLWQFLLDILTDRTHVDIIQWVGTDGEFRLLNPEEVARLWGIKKNKPAMNYEKLSRALRYYYDGDMISKVSGKRFAYKFDCDLKLLLGYDAAELSELVNEKPFTTEFMFNQQVVEEAVESILAEAD